MYRPRPPKKNILSYLLPFIVIVGIFTLIIYSFQTLILKKEYFKNTFATLNPGEKGTEVMLSGSEKWNSVARDIKLFKGDVVKTSKFSSIKLLGESKINLDKGSVVLIDKLQSNNSSSQVSITIPQGRVWIDVQRMINPKSLFKIKTENLSISTRGAILSVNGNSLRVLKGSVLVDFYDGKKSLGHLNVGVGQEMILSDSDINSLKIGTLPSLRAINDEFKLSSWYAKNYLGDGKKIEKIDSETPKEISKKGTGDTVLENQKNTENSKTEEKKEVEAKKVVNKGEITLDLEKTDLEIEKGGIVKLSGKVPTGVSSVVINGWKLSKFKPGDSKYFYYAALKWKNLKEGENIYKVEVFDNDNVKISEKEFKINVKIKEEPVKEETGSLSEKSLENKATVAEKTEDSNSSKNTSDESKSVVKIETPLQITSNKDGDFVKISDGQALEIQGIPSSGSAKINVGDYTLKSFKPGDETFKFRIAEEWGNVKIGQKNTYKITSFDKDGNEIETLNFSLFVEK